MLKKLSKPRRKNPGKYENIKKIEDVDKMKHVFFKMKYVIILP